MYRLYIIITILSSLMLSGCKPIPADVSLSDNHPANPYALPSAPIKITKAIEPQLQQPQPNLEQNKQNSVPSDQDDNAHAHHKHK